MNVLCQLNMTFLAEEMLEVLRSESKHSQVASKMPVLYPLINAYSLRGDWEKALEQYYIGSQCPAHRLLQGKSRAGAAALG